MVHIGAVRQTAQITWMSTEALRTGDKAIVNFKFVKCPEWIQAGRRFVFREGRTKAVSFFSLEAQLTLRRPLRRKLPMRWFFDISKVKESSFFKWGLTDPAQIFDAHLLETTDLSPSRFHFSARFISRSWFESDGFIAYSNEWEWTEKERCLFTLTNL